MATAFYASLRNVLSRVLAPAARLSGRRQGSPGPPAYRLVRSSRIGFADDDFPRNCLIRLIDYPDLLLRTGMRETIKAGRSALVVRADVPGRDRMLSIAWKRVRRRTWWKVLTSLMQPNRAVRAWRLGRELLARGIDTPRPLAAIIPRWVSGSRSSWLATEWVSDSVRLTEFVQQTSRRNRDECLRLADQAADRLARLIGRLHAAGFSHRDLKANNVLVRQRGDCVEVWLVDLDGVARPRWLRGTRCMRNVARLLASIEPAGIWRRTSRLRSLKTWLTTAGEDPCEWKSWWRGIDGAVAKRRAATQRLT